MNREFLKMALETRFEYTPPEAVKLYIYLMAHAVEAPNRLVLSARQDGLILSDKTYEELTKELDLPFLTIKRYIRMYRSNRLLTIENYNGVKCFKLGEIVDGKTVWNKFVNPMEGALKGKKEKEEKQELETPMDATTIAEEIRKIQRKKREETEIRNKFKRKAIGTTLGEQIVVTKEHKPVVGPTKVLDAFCAEFEKRYGGKPTDVGKLTGGFRYGKMALFRAKNFINALDNDIDRCEEIITFTFANLDKIMEIFGFDHPFSYEKLFLKKVARKIDRWTKYGIPHKRKEESQAATKRSKSVTHRYNEDSSDEVPEELQ